MELGPDVIVLVLAAGVSVGIIVAVIAVGIEGDLSLLTNRLFDLAQLLTVGVLGYVSGHERRS